MRKCLSTLFLTAAVISCPVQAAPQQPVFGDDQKYVAEIKAHSPQEISDLLNRIEMLVEAQGNYAYEPIAFVLHGQEANLFRAENYSRYREIIDKAARLDAFKVIDIQICETWMKLNNVQRSELPAFIDSVPFGPARERWYRRQGYQYF